MAFVFRIGGEGLTMLMLVVVLTPYDFCSAGKNNFKALLLESSPYDLIFTATFFLIIVARFIAMGHVDP